MTFDESNRNPSPEVEHPDQIMASVEERERARTKAMKAGQAKPPGRKSMSSTERGAISKRMRQYWQDRHKSQKLPGVDK